MAYFTALIAANFAVMTATEVALLAIAVAIFGATIAVAIVAPLPLTPPPPPAPWDEDDEDGRLEAAVLSVAELSATDSHYGLDLRRLRRRLAGMDPRDGEGSRCPRCGLHEDDRAY